MKKSNFLSGVLLTRFAEMAQENCEAHRWFVLNRQVAKNAKGATTTSKTGDDEFGLMPLWFAYELSGSRRFSTVLVTRSRGVTCCHALPSATSSHLPRSRKVRAR